MVRKFSFVVSLLVLLMMSSVIFAQDPTPTLPVEVQPVPEDVEPEGPTLESVTADPVTHYGQEVTLEGMVTEFLNVRTFVLGEGAALDDDKVLVINITPDEYAMNLVVGQRVQVTGIVMPSYEEGGLEQVLNNFMGTTMPAPDTTQPEAEVTEEIVEATVTTETEEEAEATPEGEATEEMAEATEEMAEETPAGEEGAEATPEVEATEEMAEATEEMAEATEPTEGEVADETPEAEPAEETPEMEPTVAMEATPVIEPEPITHDFVPLTDVIIERFGNFTILEVSSVTAITVIPEEVEG